MRHEVGLWENAAISSPMAAAISGWKSAFYGDPDWKIRDVRLSGLPAAITGYVATLTTGELALQFDDTPRGKAMGSLFRNLKEKLPLAVQLAAAFGFVAIRPSLENGTIVFTLAPPGRFFPTRFSIGGSVTAGYFADFSGEYVKIESFDYQKGTLTIENRAYRVRGEVLGAEMPLSVVPEWAELSPSITLEGVKGPLFGLLSMPFANLVDPGSPLPVSLYAGAMESIMEFDRVYSELLYELHSARRKNIVERTAIVPESKRKRFRGLRYQDPTTDTYVLDPAEEHSPFQDYSPSIRTESYLSGLRAILHIIENQCHLSPGSLALDDRTGAMTATEVISQDRTTYHTCAAIQQQGLTPAIVQLVHAVEALGDVYGLLPEGETEVSVSYGDGVFEDTQKEFVRRMEMLKAGVIDADEVRKWYFGGESKDS